MKLNVLPDEYFSCKSCTDCCRRQMVELFEGEPEKIAKFKWPADDPLNDVQPFSRHGGKTYFAHKPSGACVYLNESNGLCRIHEEFGPEAKCIACRIFPFQITPTFAGEASVTARYDCPTVRRNQGDRHAESLPLLRKYTDKWMPTAGFDEATRCHLDREQIEAVAEFLSTLIGGFPRNDQRALFISYLCDALATTAADQLNRPALASAYGPLREQIEAATAGEIARPGLVHRAAFRTLLALHLRRDEDVLDGRAGRIRRLFSMAAFVLGFGSFRGLGLFHPPGRLKNARLFKRLTPPSTAQSVKSDATATMQSTAAAAGQSEATAASAQSEATMAAQSDAAAPETFALLWRLVRNKLDALQFLGPANGDRDFLRGLRSLSLLYPLTMAAAKHHAATRGAATIEAADVDYAVTAIEHSFGRAAVLRQPFVKSIEKLLIERESLARLVATI